MKYKILGGNMPVVECILEEGERIYTEKGSMCWMSQNIVMETRTGGLNRIFSKMITHETVFQNAFRSRKGEGTVAFATCLPGQIIPVEIKPEKELFCEKSVFLASEEGVKLSIHIKKRLGAGFFGGDGFIMEKLSGNGIAFLEIAGSFVKKTLEKKEKILVNTGHVAAMSGTCTMDVTFVKGVKNLLFGTEDVFYTTVEGPGDVYLQTMPLSNLADLIISKIPKPQETKEEKK